jgi:signal transduction histidine kinase/ActR/RegA family two-component response regulator
MIGTSHAPVPIPTEVAPSPARGLMEIAGRLAMAGSPDEVVEAIRVGAREVGAVDSVRVVRGDTDADEQEDAGGGAASSSVLTVPLPGGSTAIRFGWSRPHSPSAETLAALQTLALTGGALLRSLEALGAREGDVAALRRAEAGLRAGEIARRRASEREQERLAAAERAARARADEIDRLKDEFIDALSHEMRTPLSNVVNWSRLIDRAYDGDNELVRRGLKVIATNAMAQSQLLSDLADMSRIRQGRMTLAPEPVDLNELVAQAIASQKPAAEAKSVRILFEQASGNATVLADPLRLQQVFWNLLSNAIKFSAGNGPIVIRTKLAPEHCEVSIRDRGEGIAPEQLAHVFERFRQADGGAARRHGGLGLGLALVKQLVELHGGTVWAESDGAGRGATFTVSLRTRPALDREPFEVLGTRSDRLDEVSGENLAGMHVLIVEDQSAALDYLRHVLEEHGARVTAARSAPNALEEIEAHQADPFDVVVSDIGMPGMDGYSMMRSIRGRLRLSAEALPGVAVTAFARKEDRDRALGAGFQAHLAKPYAVGELVRTVHRLGTQENRPLPGAPATAG